MDKQLVKLRYDPYYDFYELFPIGSEIQTIAEDEINMYHVNHNGKIVSMNVSEEPLFDWVTKQIGKEPEEYIKVKRSW